MEECLPRSKSPTRFSTRWCHTSSEKIAIESTSDEASSASSEQKGKNLFFFRTVVENEKIVHKVRKPLMERRRRERINLSLEQLKSMLLENAALRREFTKPTKLEKADILEMTVRHLRSIAVAPYNETQKFREGFLECVQIVRRFAADNHLYESLNSRLLHYIEQCSSKLTSEKEEHPASNLSMPSVSTPFSSNQDMYKGGEGTLCLIWRPW